MGHRVTAAAVQVAIGRRVHMLDKGDIVPEGVEPATIKRLTERGFIATFEKEADADKVEFPSKDWNHDRIDAWAAAQSPAIEFVNADPSKTITKEQKLEQIAAAVAERSAKQ